MVEAIFCNKYTPKILTGSGYPVAIFLFEFVLTIAQTTKIANTPNNIADEPIVPKFRPPFAIGFVSRSPNVAPKGRVKTKAIQNKTTLDIVVK